MYQLDPILQNDTYKVADLKLCELLLMDNADFPWLILVPRQQNLVELTDLSFDDQTLLLKEINQTSNLLKTHFNADKINIATLGNVVKQLHIHVIARFANDKAFPNPVWGVKSAKYDAQNAKKTIEKIKNHYE